MLLSTSRVKMRRNYKKMSKNWKKIWNINKKGRNIMNIKWTNFVRKMNSWWEKTTNKKYIKNSRNNSLLICTKVTSEDWSNKLENSKSEIKSSKNHLSITWLKLLSICSKASNRHLSNVLKQVPCTYLIVQLELAPKEEKDLPVQMKNKILRKVTVLLTNAPVLYRSLVSRQNYAKPTGK